MNFIDRYSIDFVEDSYDLFKLKIIESDNLLKSKKCLGNEMLGWVNPNVNLNLINQVATQIIKTSECVFVIGIGGSYLGAKMSIDFLNPTNKKNIHFIGTNLDSEFLINLLEKSKNKSIHTIVISKSGNTIEIKATLNIIINFMKKKYAHINEKFTAITGKSGYLRGLAEKNEWNILDIPDDIGGRFSVLTNVGLLPMCVSGIKIEDVLSGAMKMKEKSESSFSACHKYATIRSVLYNFGFKVELFSAFSTRLLSAMEWIKQLFGESEGKNFKGIFPASAMFSTDLHSLGQFIQEGSRILFETIIFCQNQNMNLEISSDISDSLLRNKTFNELNEKIFNSTVKAHNLGGTPCNIIKLTEFSEENLGKFIYFFEKSCALSALSLDVNPFNQPGVEMYKKHIFS